MPRRSSQATSGECEARAILSRRRSEGRSMNATRTLRTPYPRKRRRPRLTRPRFESHDQPFTEKNDLGRCCSCGTDKNVTNILCLPFRAPIAGTGWGCAVCRTPSDGAVTVLCDQCVKDKSPPLFACFGAPEEKGRIAVKELTTPFGHDQDSHIIRGGK